MSALEVSTSVLSGKSFVFILSYLSHFIVSCTAARLEDDKDHNHVEKAGGILQETKNSEMSVTIRVQHVFNYCWYCQ